MFVSTLRSLYFCTSQLRGTCNTELDVALRMKAFAAGCLFRQLHHRTQPVLEATPVFLCSGQASLLTKVGQHSASQVDPFCASFTPYF